MDREWWLRRGGRIPALTTNSSANHQRSRLLSAQEPHAPGEGTAHIAAEEQEVRGVDVVVHKEVIAPTGDVVEPGANGKQVIVQLETAFQVRVQGEEGWEPM